MSRLAAMLLRMAGTILPRERADWFAAMSAEISYLPPRAAFTWALGCVVAALKQRLVPMQLGTLRIPRWVMFVETMGAFAPLTMGWYAIALGQPGVLRHFRELFSPIYLDYPGGAYIVTMLLACVVVGLLGPIGLFLGLRHVFTGSGIRSRALGYTLMGAPLFLMVFGTIAGYFTGPPDFAPIWSHTIVFTLLPVACVAHLMYLARPDEVPPLSA